MEQVETCIERLLTIEWFSCVGVSVGSNTRIKIRHVNSWLEALALRGSPKIADAFSEGCGMLTRELSARFRVEYRRWNQIAREARDALEASVFPKVDEFIDSSPEIRRAESGPELAKLSVRWDLIHCIMEEVYSDVVPTRFYGEVLQIYKAGHFPCGWDEIWPEGTVWIY